MRKIEFQAKRTDNGEWVRGCYDCNGATFNCVVDSSTISECTGERDKNLNMIFENHIVKYSNIIGVVIFNGGCFCIKDTKSKNCPAIDLVLNKYGNKVEIIGNIFDNTELLVV